MNEAKVIEVRAWNLGDDTPVDEIPVLKEIKVYSYRDAEEKAYTLAYSLKKVIQWNYQGDTCFHRIITDKVMDAWKNHERKQK